MTKGTLRLLFLLVATLAIWTARPAPLGATGTCYLDFDYKAWDINDNLVIDSWGEQYAFPDDEWGCYDALAWIPSSYAHGLCQSSIYIDHVLEDNGALYFDNELLDYVYIAANCCEDFSLNCEDNGGGPTCLEQSLECGEETPPCCTGTCSEGYCQGI